MKHVNVVNRWVALVLLVGSAVACQQAVTEQVQPTPPVAEAKTDEKVTKLLERALLPGTKAEYEAITAAYKALTFAQLETFNQLKSKADEQRMVQQLTDAGARVSAQQIAVITGQLQQVNEFRTELNQQSVAQYGVPYNQLSDSTLNVLLGVQTETVNPVGLDEVTDPNARMAAPQACSSASFPYVASKVSNGTQEWSGWTSRSTPNHPNDCDYEFRYSGYRYNFDPKDWFADRLCDSFNNKLARRYSSPNTYILFGNRGVWLWIGWPGLTSVNMR